MVTKFQQTIAMPLKFETLYVGVWRQNLLVADNYGEGRVLLAGDAAHLVIPTGGLGMLGLIEPTQGELLIDGVPLTTIGARVYRESVAAVMAMRSGPSACATR